MRFLYVYRAEERTTPPPQERCPEGGVDREMTKAAVGRGCSEVRPIWDAPT
jgi:hypothetical protein